MTREEAIQALKDLRDIRLQGVEWKESLDMAIEALQTDRPNGAWRKYDADGDVYDLKGVHTWGVEYQCPFCGQIHTLIEDFGQWNFCPECGADMKGGNR